MTSFCSRSSSHRIGVSILHSLLNSSASRWYSKAMKNSFRICALAALIFGLSTNQCYSQTGFISIDCGGSANFTDRNGIQWVSDQQFIQVGEVVNLSAISGQVNLPRQETTLRKFPERNKNCYELSPVEIGSKYLLRATFVYDNYDGLNSPPNVTLILDADIWDTVNLQSLEQLNSESLPKEIVFVARFDPTNVCLAKGTGDGLPVISSLELRPLRDNMYWPANRNYSLLNLERTDFGTPLSSTSRYPDDPFDRIWTGNDDSSSLYLYTADNVSTGSAVDRPSSSVMRTAVRSPDGTPSTFALESRRSAKNGYLYFSLYFAEVEVLNDTEIREFQAYLDGTLLSSTVIRPQYLTSSNVSVLKLYGITYNMVLSFRNTARADKNPLINALEIYRQSPLLQNGTYSLDVDAVVRFRHEFGYKYPSGGDPCLPSGFSWDWLSCNTDANPRITSVNLSDKRVNGRIPASITGLTALEVLDLSRNRLSGPIPEFLASLTNLRVLNLADNNFSGEVPAALSKKPNLQLSLSGNPLLCQEGIRNCKAPASIKNIYIGTIIPAVLLFVIILSVASWVIYTRKERNTEKDFAGVLSSAAKRFRYHEIRDMTKNFRTQIGKGGFGPVFHGHLRDGMEVAVKRLSDVSKQGTDEFIAEVSLLSRVHHRNLVALVGYCCEGKHRMLVYEYMTKGNLKDLLHRNDTGYMLDWVTRIRIAWSSAQGLEYLHTACTPPIIHRDVKTSNILLNDKMEAKLSDFGLSRSPATEEATHISTEVKGTFGYLDPEYATLRRLTEKSDVYSIGVVIFEMISGRMAIDPDAESADCSYVVAWARSVVASGNIQEIVDKRVSGDINSATAWNLVDLGMRCTEAQGKDRPSMTEVVNELQEIYRTVMRQTDTSQSSMLLETQISSTPAPR